MRAVQGANLDARSEMALGDHEMVRWVDGHLLSIWVLPCVLISQSVKNHQAWFLIGSPFDHHGLQAGGSSQSISVWLWNVVAFSLLFVLSHGIAALNLMSLMSISTFVACSLPVEIRPACHGLSSEGDQSAYRGPESSSGGLWNGTEAHRRA